MILRARCGRIVGDEITDRSIRCGLPHPAALSFSRGESFVFFNEQDGSHLLRALAAGFPAAEPVGRKENEYREPAPCSRRVHKWDSSGDVLGVTSMYNCSNG